MRTIAVTVFLVLAISAHAQEASPDGGAPTDGGAPPAAAQKPGDEFNFELQPAPVKPNLLDDAAQRKLESRVKLRRKLLTAHQVLGFITLGLLAVTNIIGTLVYVDKYGGGTDTGTLYPYHEWFSIGTTVTSRAPLPSGLGPTLMVTALPAVASKAR